MMTKGRADGIILNGTMGQNDWYISPVTISFDNENGSWVRYFVQIDAGAWFEYTGPIVVNTEGAHIVNWYYIDQNGNQSSIYSVFFKIDMTPPYVKITEPEKGFLSIGFISIKLPDFFTTIIIGTIDVITNATDNQSGVNRVEFWVNDQHYYNATKLPYNWIWKWRGHLFPYELKVIAFDNAGNQNSDELMVWKIF